MKNPIKKSKSANEFLKMADELGLNRNWGEYESKKLSKRKMQIEDRYVQAKKIRENHPFETHSSQKRKQINSPHGIGEILRNGRESQCKQRNEKICAKIRETPLILSEKRYWNKILVLKSFIKRDLQDFRKMYKASALKHLYQLILRQEQTREFDYRELYNHISQKYKELYRDRLRE